jgi:hypothetical protein
LATPTDTLPLTAPIDAAIAVEFAVDVATEESVAVITASPTLTPEPRVFDTYAVEPAAIELTTSTPAPAPAPEYAPTATATENASIVALIVCAEPEVTRSSPVADTLELSTEADVKAPLAEMPTSCHCAVLP